MKFTQCPCGARLEGATDEDFVAAVKKHFEDVHPEMSGHYTDEQILSRAQTD
jgi:hypothetical protein